MTEHDFNAAFKDVATQAARTSSQEPSELVEQLMRRDQTRTRFLAGASLFCWLISAAGMILLVDGLNRFIIGVRIGRDETALLHHSMPFLAASILALLLAALFTVLLIFSSRQATMNRINVSLARISREFLRLQGHDFSVTAGSSCGLAATTPAATPRLKRFWFWAGWAIALIAVVSTITMSVEYYVARKDLLYGGSPRLSPFEAIYWDGDTADVQVNGHWYVLHAINNIPVSDILQFDKRTWGGLWQKRFNEDLIALLMDMHHFPDTTATLDLTDLTSGQPIVLKDAPMTSANRTRLLEVDLGLSPPTTRP
jgi:hypothetical protein